MNRKFVAVIISLLIITLNISSIVASGFTDVSKDHWAYYYANKLKEIKISDGMGSNAFGLGKEIKRSEFLDHLVKILKFDIYKPERSSFTDNNDKSQWYYASIETALKNGVITTEHSTFRPNDYITKEEMVVMAVRALGYSSIAQKAESYTCPFTDVNTNKGFITIANDLGLLYITGNVFNPNDTVKREHAAYLLVRIYDKLASKLNELHAFYAIRSANQMDMINSLSSVSFGWGRLEFDKSNSVVINTTLRNDNEYFIPTGFQNPMEIAQKNNIPSLFMFAVKDDVAIIEGKSKNIQELILTNKAIREKTIKDMVAIVNKLTKDNAEKSFDGVVIDFENMKGETLKNSFNSFLVKLKEELTKSGKLLYVTVPPKRSSNAYFDAYDYKAIGEIADKVILMAHDYNAKKLSITDMKTGNTLTPLTPIDEVYYALKAITDEKTGVSDRSKILLQINFATVQWKLKNGQVINELPYTPIYDSVMRRLKTSGISLNFVTRYQNPSISFIDEDGASNIVWYEDSRSVAAKIDLAKLFNIQGISLWRLGNIPNYEDDAGKKAHLNVWNKILQNIK